MLPASDMTSQPPTSARKSAHTAASLGMLGLLGVQFLFGMATNLFVTLPSSGIGMMEMMHGGPLVMIHIMLGIILAIGAVFAVAAAAQYGYWAIVWAVISLGGILVAGIGGLIFLLDGLSNGASFLMAVGFLVTVTGYIADLAKGT